MSKDKIVRNSGKIRGEGGKEGNGFYRRVDPWSAVVSIEWLARRLGSHTLALAGSRADRRVKKKREEKKERKKIEKKIDSPHLGGSTSVKVGDIEVRRSSPDKI